MSHLGILPPALFSVHGETVPTEGVAGNSSRASSVKHIKHEICTSEVLKKIMKQPDVIRLSITSGPGVAQDELPSK